jgi:hypothetical protein
MFAKPMVQVILMTFVRIGALPIWEAARCQDAAA